MKSEVSHCSNLNIFILRNEFLEKKNKKCVKFTIFIFAAGVETKVRGGGN